MSDPLREALTALEAEWRNTVYEWNPAMPMTLTEFCRYWFVDPLRALLAEHPAPAQAVDREALANVLRDHRAPQLFAGVLTTTWECRCGALVPDWFVHVADALIASMGWLDAADLKAEAIREVSRRIYNGAGDPEQEFYDHGVAPWLERIALEHGLRAGGREPESALSDEFCTCRGGPHGGYTCPKCGAGGQ